MAELRFTLPIVAIIFAYTWVLAPRTPRSVSHLVTFLVLALSIWRAVRTGEWGLRRSALWPALRGAAAFTLPAVLVLCVVGSTLGAVPRRANPWGDLAFLLPWAAGQQFALQTVLLREAQAATSRRQGILLAAAVFMLMTNLGLFPAAGAALAFSGLRLVAALAFNTLFGALQTLGIGNYAPCLIVFSLMGLDTHAAFPIMMGSGAFPAMAAGIKFIQTRRYDLRTSLGLTIGGIPAVLIAGLIVRSMSLTTVRWLVVCVVIYTGVTMLRSAWQNAPSGRQAIPL